MSTIVGSVHLYENAMIQRTASHFIKAKNISGIMMLTFNPLVTKFMEMTSVSRELHLFSITSQIDECDRLYCNLSDLYNNQVVGYNQIQAWRNPEVRNWMTNFYQPRTREGDIFSHLPKEVFHIITSILSGLSERDSASLHIKICVPMFRKIFADNLKTYIKDLENQKFLKAKVLFGSKSAKQENEVRITCLTLARSLFNKIDPTKDRRNQQLDKYATDLLNEQTRLNSDESLSKTLVTKSGQHILETYKTLVGRACKRI